ncbi:hypothetical protein D9757_006464 [Collybiopsis confluens]|uniref:FAD-binding domain-containing protein n=1 Tax=Collybiopsis confluens TaxID=2823264 RepID=A0A8H5M8D6_9AGAR|nr:hypothetical protein D9757_006464 [Collybiopsis confluens]
MSESQQDPPKHVQILIIGGGPAGSYAASAIAREGLDVAVLESAKFPRYHIGESLIPSVRPYLRFIGAEEKVENHGFVKKPGSAIKFNQFKREGYTDFVALGANNNAWNVTRSEFDQLLLNHAQECGAKVYEQTRVTSIEFDQTDPEKPVSVSWTRYTTTTSTTNDSEGIKETSRATTTFSYLIDASGRAGFMSNNCLKNRRFNASLKNIAIWGYWSNDAGGDGIGSYGKGTSREGAPWFEALTNESGWAWCIGLRGKTSVGIVMDQEQYNAKLSSSSKMAPTLTHRYLAHLRSAPGVIRLLSGRDLGGDSVSGVEDRPFSYELSATLEPGSVRIASDYSYSAPSYAGKGYRIVGDAGGKSYLLALLLKSYAPTAFIDPFFSSGIHLAFTGALSAAATICASVKNQCTEAEAAAWHTKRVAVSYTRFQIVVLSAYKQMRAQSVDVMSDVDEDNFDRAFAYLRPVIQGASDMGTRLSESELQQSLDFCINLFNPTTPEEHDEIEGRLGQGKGKELMDVTKPVVDPKLLLEVLKVSKREVDSSSRLSSDGEGENGTRASGAGGELGGVSLKEKMVLDKINARRVVHPEYAINNFEAEELEGYVVNLEKGRLGLVKAM